MLGVRGGCLVWCGVAGEKAGGGLGKDEVTGLGGGECVGGGGGGGGGGMEVVVVVAGGVASGMGCKV